MKTAKRVEMAVSGRIAANPEATLKSGMDTKTYKDNVEECDIHRQCSLFI